VAQAFHWFKHDQFFAEAKRVLKPGGVIALWTYATSKVGYEVDRLVFEFYENILGDYWEKERKLVDEGYKNCPFPFEKIKTPEFTLIENWKAEDFIGYLSTWSALQTYIKKNEKNPLEEMAYAIMLAWENDKAKKVRWPLSVIVGRV
jgi:SAM-dependent methyltransferase